MPVYSDVGYGDIAGRKEEENKSEASNSTWRFIWKYAITLC